MNSIEMTIWGRKFNIEIFFECYDNEAITNQQREALHKFLNVSEMLDDVLPAIKQYCLDDENMSNKHEIDNIFKYVMPNTLYIERNEKKNVIALLCEYKFDIEHGIAIVYENEKYKGIISQSSFL